MKKFRSDDLIQCTPLVCVQSAEAPQDNINGGVMHSAIEDYWCRLVVVQRGPNCTFRILGSGEAAVVQSTKCRTPNIVWEGRGELCYVFLFSFCFRHQEKVLLL